MDRSYINSSDWIKIRKATKNLVNDDGEWFQYVPTVALNHEEMENIHKEYQKLNLMKNITGKDYPSGKYAQKKLEKNYLTIALNVLCSKNEYIYPPYISKRNSNHEKRIVLSMIYKEG